MTKKFWVLESNTARKPFYAKSATDWTFNVNEALKFADFNAAFIYRHKHDELKFYALKEMEFDFDFNDEDLYVRDQQQTNFNFEGQDDRGT